MYESAMPSITSGLFRVLLLSSVLGLSACTSITTLMFVPYKVVPVTPDKLGLEYTEVEHQAVDGTQLVSWWLPAQGEYKGRAKGSVLFLHGNAQNISYHQFSANWLPKHGYNVLLLGYREYGQSEGLAKLPDIFMDVHAGLDWLLGPAQSTGPVYILGQSMGGSLAVYGLASYPRAERVAGVVLDSTFDSYPGVAAAAMARNWFTWPLVLGAWSISDAYDPAMWITSWPQGMPLLMLHSPEDQVVPYEQGRALFDLAKQPKHWLDGQGKHITTFNHEYLRLALLSFLDSPKKLPIRSG